VCVCNGMLQACRNFVDFDQSVMSSAFASNRWPRESLCVSRINQTAAPGFKDTPSLTRLLRVVCVTHRAASTYILSVSNS